MHLSRLLFTGTLTVFTACVSAANLPPEGPVFTATPDRPVYDSRILQLAEAAPLHDHKNHAPAEKQLPYVCPMHEDVQSDKPGKCPKCGMKLELRKASEAEEKGHDHK